MITIITFIQRCFYRAVQILPNGLLTLISNFCANHFIWQDAFAPEAFFEPCPELMPTASAGASTAFQGWNALSKLRIAKDVSVSGSVGAVEPSNQPYWHDAYYIQVDPLYRACLNRFNNDMNRSWANTAGWLKVYVPRGSKLPVVGTRVIAYGDQIIDLSNGWIGLISAKLCWNLLN